MKLLIISPIKHNTWIQYENIYLQLFTHVFLISRHDMSKWSELLYRATTMRRKIYQSTCMKSIELFFSKQRNSSSSRSVLLRWICDLTRDQRRERTRGKKVQHRRARVTAAGAVSWQSKGKVRGWKADNLCMRPTQPENGEKLALAHLRVLYVYTRTYRAPANVNVCVYNIRENEDLAGHACERKHKGE